MRGVAADGFELVTQPRSFSFPEDHGEHPGFRNEWWYFTGNLTTKSQRRFGFQLVFFHNALAPGVAVGSSPWRSNQGWMAHFALTDVQTEEFHAFERLSRGSMGLAGVERVPLKVWLDQWSATWRDGSWWLSASQAGVGIELELKELRRPVLQGDAGLSQKSSALGNASYYYSIPRLQVSGEVVLAGQQYPVAGDAWLDREWSTSALDERHVGWDWFALQLSDGSELMFYRLRLKGGEIDPHSAGSWLQADGRLIRLGLADIQLEEVGSWQSPKGGNYPLYWRLVIPAHGLELEVSPLIEDQELDLLLRYWEGAVEVVGRRAGENIQGRGYLELTGYAE